MLLMVDNYDSFAHNLARYLRRFGLEVLTLRNDAINVEQVGELAPEAIILSPGPCTPTEAGCSLDVVRQLGGSIPILGVCLGHQAIAAAMGANIVRADTPMHGRASRIDHDREGVFLNLPTPLTVGRYHSLVVEPATLPINLRVTARDRGGAIMAIQHVEWPVVGVQFHPESILTDHGYQMLGNFLDLAGIRRCSPDKVPSIQHELRIDPGQTPPLPTIPITF